MTAPLLRLSELKRQMNTTLSSKLSSVDEAAANLRLRELIDEASALFTDQANGRRFDRRIETRYYTPYLLEDGGDLICPCELALDADLLSIISLTNGDGTAITAGYSLTPRNRTAKYGVRLNPQSTTTWNVSSDGDPVGCVEVEGVWGWGGAWKATGSVVGDNPLAAAATTINVGDGGAGSFEIDQVLKIDAEYLLVVDVTDNPAPATDTITVERGYNGSTGAEHAQSTAIYYYLADADVRRAVVRLVSWAIEQSKSPMFGSVQVADISIPVNMENMPNDVVRLARKLAWRNRLGAA